MHRTNSLSIRTPEGVLFSQALAGPTVRFLAWGIDAACVVSIASLITYFTGVLVVISPDFARAMAVLLYPLISIGYGITLEWHWRGQTFGKRLLRLRVMDAEGLRLQFSQIAIRNLLRFVDMLPVMYLVGGITCVINRRGQRLGDLAANTVVARIPKLKQPDLSQLFAGKFNSLRAYPHIVARFRQRVSPVEAALALNALLRRDELEPMARVDLFRDIANYFRQKSDFPAEATEGISDEQFVRNVADVIYRTRQSEQRLPA